MLTRTRSGFEHLFRSFIYQARTIPWLTHTIRSSKTIFRLSLQLTIFVHLEYMSENLVLISKHRIIGYAVNKWVEMGIVKAILVESEPKKKLRWKSNRQFAKRSKCHDSKQYNNIILKSSCKTRIAKLNYQSTRRTSAVKSYIWSSSSGPSGVDI